MAELIPTVTIEVIAVASGTITTVGVSIMLAKLNKISKLYTTIFGLEDVESVDGLVGVVENLQENQEQLAQNQEKIQERVDEIEKKVENL